MIYIFGMNFCGISNGVKDHCSHMANEFYLSASSVKDAVTLSQFEGKDLDDKTLQLILTSQLDEGNIGAMAKFMQMVALRNAPPLGASEEEWKKYIDIVYQSCSCYSTAIEKETLPLDIQSTLENKGYQVQKLPFASGSMCSIYKVKKEDEEYVLKIPHPESITRAQRVISVIRHFASYVKSRVGISNIEDAFETMKALVLEEGDPKKEVEKINSMQQIFQNHPYIRIPRIIELNEKFFIMEFMKGEKHIVDFYNSGSDNERKKLAQLLMTFLFKSLARGLWYTDFNGCCAKIHSADDKIFLEMLDFGACMFLTKQEANALIRFCQFDEETVATDFFKTFGCQDAFSIKALTPLFQVYIKPLRKNEPTQFLYAREEEAEYNRIMKNLEKMPNIYGPKKIFSLLKWFQQVNYILYSLHLPPMNFYQMIQESQKS